MTLGVDLDPPGFHVSGRAAARTCPKAWTSSPSWPGGSAPTPRPWPPGPRWPALARLLATAHNIGVMERLRDLPSPAPAAGGGPLLQGLARAAHLPGHRGRLRPGLLRGTEGPGPGLLPGAAGPPRRRHPLPGRAAAWPICWPWARWSGARTCPRARWWWSMPWVLPQLASVLDLLDLAPQDAAEDMSPEEQILYSVPIFLRRFFSRANPKLAAEALAMVVARLQARAGDRRPLSALYTCESFELLAGSMDPTGRASLPAVLQSWVFHDSAQRPAHGLAGAAPAGPATASRSPDCWRKWAAAWTPRGPSPGARPAWPSCSCWSTAPGSPAGPTWPTAAGTCGSRTAPPSGR